MVWNVEENPYTIIVVECHNRLTYGKGWGGGGTNVLNKGSSPSVLTP